jgi:2-polyprenyl-3-methyl-5-hydroxy-6-metoxy-1,4-benzoquinol methylase
MNSSPTARPTLLIFVIAYHAESPLTSLLERIPRSLFDTYDCEVLVVDDAAEDRTFAIGREYQRSHPELRMTVLRNEYHQGYGGNQKVGYSYAIARQFDFVAIVRGDGQHAPEDLPRLIEPLRAGEADAVFGSRMMQRFGALKGGMPLYKYVGNKVLTTAQNALLGTKLSEFHSGYRVYSVKLLGRIHYRLNSNDFHFDTEITIQLLNARARILELPIPTYYGDEICLVNGMKYAKDVLWATVQSVAHRSGLSYQRRFDSTAEANTHYDVKLGYASSHTYAIDAIPRGAKVLDIGSGPGPFARELHRKGCEVTVVDRYAPAVPTPEVTVITQDFDDPLTFDVNRYEYLLLLDVIEHLHDPERFLELLRKRFDHQPKKLILSTPNIAFVVQRLMLLGGQFNYGKAGILDRTHTRLFTFRSIRNLVRDAGFKIVAIRGVPAPFPKVLGNGLLGRAAVAANIGLIRINKALFSYQIFVEAESTPDLDFLVNNAEVSGVRCGATVEKVLPKRSRRTDKLTPTRRKLS